MLALIYLVHVAVVVFGAVTLVWLISLMMKDASIIDIFWGFGFALVGAIGLYLVSGRATVSPSAYLWLMGLMPILWGLRLTIYLAKRNLGHGEDGRYVAMRKRSGLAEMTWRLRALFTIFWGQGLLILIVSAPVWVAMATGRTTELGWLAILGGLVWLAGTLFEAIGDWQLARFLEKHKDYDGPYEDKPVMDDGLWAWTRHPNYFGNALLWWGIFIAACQAPWGWATIVGPIIMTTLLVRVSGRDLLERKLKKRPAYREYVENTSSFIPRPPKSSS
jgi:steroid 5-alpha reductase family enzyme